MEHETLTVRGLQFEARRDTTDKAAIDEVVQRRCYTGAKLHLPEDARVLDLGANIGAFTVYAASLGCSVVAYEPVDANLEQLRRNAELNTIEWQLLELHNAVVVADPGDGSAVLATPPRARNQYRYTALPKKGWATTAVPAVSFEYAVQAAEPRVIKMDIEGAELEILDLLGSQPELLAGVDYFLGEYHLDYDPNLANYHRRMEMLSAIFDHAHYPKLPFSGQWSYWPSGKTFRFWNDPAV